MFLITPGPCGVLCRVFFLSQSVRRGFCSQTGEKESIYIQRPRPYPDPVPGASALSVWRCSAGKWYPAWQVEAAPPGPVPWFSRCYSLPGSQGPCGAGADQAHIGAASCGSLVFWWCTQPPPTLSPKPVFQSGGNRWILATAGLLRSRFPLSFPLTICGRYFGTWTSILKSPGLLRTATLAESQGWAWPSVQRGWRTFDLRTVCKHRKHLGFPGSVRQSNLESVRPNPYEWPGVLKWYLCPQPPGS